jgi:HPt (histidine-containing phosphotransfer) domain-containing protein
LLNKLIRDKYPPKVVEEARRQAAELNMAKQEEAALASDPELAAIFSRDAEKAIERLNAICENAYRNDDDIRQYIINVHAMKSALTNIGETGLSAAAFKLEQAGRAGDVKVMIAKTPAFLEALRNVVEKNKPKEEDADGEATDEDAAYLSQKLADLQAACADYDKRTAKEITSELKQKTWPHQVKELLNTISEYLLHSDFEEAAKLAKDWHF